MYIEIDSQICHTTYGFIEDTEPQTLKVQRSESECKDVLYIGLLFRFTKFNEARKLQNPLYETAHPSTIIYN
jgi:hypothetical protein